MSIYASSEHGFDSLLRIASSSVASPPWFAIPIDAQETQDAITIVFHVPEDTYPHVQVRAQDQRVTLSGDARSVRICALPYSIPTNGLERIRVGDSLRVRIPKKRPAIDSTDSSSTRVEG